jgi:serine/threonine-protein kinase
MNWETNWNIIDNHSKNGGQGAVFKVKNKENEHIVGALKLLHESQTKSSMRRERFGKEIEALKKLNSNSIPKILDYNNADTNPVPYFVAEWIDGEDLSDYVTKESLTIKDALILSRKLALIVDSCHQESIIHRDIKPQNIRVKDEEPILIDFGLCWTLNEEDKSSNKTPLGEELGNRFLRLPELTAGSGSKHDRICDITFIVGILFYLATGKYPRQLKDSDDKMPQERLTTSELQKLQTLDKWNEVNRIFKVGFQQSSNLRFQSCIELIESIDKVLNDKEEMDETAEYNEYKQQLSDIINTDELNQKRAAIKQFKRINENFYNDAKKEFSPVGLGISINENSSNTYHKKNMYINNDMFPEKRIILSHSISIENDKVIGSYSLQSNSRGCLIEENYYEGYIVDIESLEDSVNSYKKNIFQETLKECLTEWTQ